jgi:adenylate kinase
MLNIIICGAPGCGKGTQSDLIVDKYTLKHLSTGDLLREEIAKKSKLGMEAESFISKGNLVPDEMILDILSIAIDEQTKNSKGIILDGFPRNVAQAEALEKLMTSLNKETTLLIDLHVDKQELIDRLLKRGETSGRSDDNLDTIKKRLEVYENKTAPVSDFYKNKNKYAAINGMGTIDEIFQRISSVIDSKR